MHEIPQHEGLLGEALVGQKEFGFGGQCDAQLLRGRLGHVPEARSFAVAEDAAPGELHDLARRDRLREEHGRVRVVSGGEVDEFDRDEGGVVVRRRLECGDPLGPDGAHHDGLDVAIGVAVLGVHREDDQVLYAVTTMLIGVEALQRVEEVRHSQATFTP